MTAGGTNKRTQSSGTQNIILKTSMWTVLGKPLRAAALMEAAKRAIGTGNKFHWLDDNNGEHNLHAEHSDPIHGFLPACKSVQSESNKQFPRLQDHRGAEAD